MLCDVMWKEKKLLINEILKMVGNEEILKNIIFSVTANNSYLCIYKKETAVKEKKDSRIVVNIRECEVLK